MSKERFVRLDDRLDNRLTQKRREEYERALSRFQTDIMFASPESGRVPSFNYKAKSPEVENIFCEYHYYMTESINIAMFPHKITDASNPLAILACRCEENHEGQIGGPFHCYFKETDLRIDTGEKKVVVRFDCNQYVCPYFKPTEDVLSMAKEQLKALEEKSEEETKKEITSSR